MQQRPYFFRAADLKATYAQAGSDPQGVPNIRIEYLTEFVDRLSAGLPDDELPPLLVAASEAAVAVERLQQAETSSVSGGTPQVFSVRYME